MKLLLLISLSVLLSYGVVEAQQDIYTDCIHTAPSGKTYDICRMPDLRKILEFENEPLPRKLATCDPDMTICETPCERKMREAMKAMDKIMRGEWVHTPYNTYEYQSMVPNAQERKLWDRVMKECVRP